MLWAGRGRHPFPMKNSSSQLTQGQREMFTKLLEGAQTRAQADLEDNDDIRERVTDEVIPKLAEERGALTLVEKVRKHRKEIEDTEEALKKLGFRCDDEDISLAWDVPELKKAVETAVKTATRERDEQLKQFDRAILSVWTAEDVSAAKAIVEGLI